MNYIKMTVKSNYVELRLFIKEKECYDVLEKVREIHCLTPVGYSGYSIRGRFQHPENNLVVVMKKARVKKDISRNTKVRLNEINDRDLDILEKRLQYYKQAA